MSRSLASRSRGFDEIGIAGQRRETVLELARAHAPCFESSLLRWRGDDLVVEPEMGAKDFQLAGHEWALLAPPKANTVIARFMRAIQLLLPGKGKWIARASRAMTAEKEYE